MRPAQPAAKHSSARPELMAVGAETIAALRDGKAPSGLSIFNLIGLLFT